MESLWKVWHSRKIKVNVTCEPFTLVTCVAALIADVTLAGVTLAALIADDVSPAVDFSLVAFAVYASLRKRNSVLSRQLHIYAT